MKQFPPKQAMDRVSLRQGGPLPCQCCASCSLCSLCKASCLSSLVPNLDVCKAT